MTSRAMPEAGRWVAIGALLAGLAVAAGAFGAHALSDHLSSRGLEIFDTATRYQLIHSLALLFVGLAADASPHEGWHRAGLLFAVGILLFSGSLYLLSVTGLSWLGAITPLGGICFLAGWTVMALTGWSLGDR